MDSLFYYNSKEVTMEIIDLREHSHWLEPGIRYFQDRWASEARRPVYDDCIRHSVNSPSPLPHWILLVEGDEILGGAGLITNDFISRMDLWPWLCALFVEPSHRGNDLGRLLIEHLQQMTKDLGFKALYLASDHLGYYERFGFKVIGNGHHPCGESSMIFKWNVK
jgi:GNAT superfamily N-acetyltransferase